MYPVLHSILNWTLLAGVVILVYSGLTFLEAYLEVRAAPREPMFICEKNPKHGMFLAKHCIEFMPGVKYCPLCFHETSKRMERTLGLGR
jgi:hypothetical protein